MKRTFLAAFLGLALSASVGEPRTIELTVTEKGFEPTPVKVKKGEPLKLVITRKTTKDLRHGDCGQGLQHPDRAAIGQGRDH